MKRIAWILPAILFALAIGYFVNTIPGRQNISPRGLCCVEKKMPEQVARRFDTCELEYGTVVGRQVAAEHAQPAGGFVRLSHGIDDGAVRRGRIQPLHLLRERLASLFSPQHSEDIFGLARRAAATKLYRS